MDKIFTRLKPGKAIKLDDVRELARQVDLWGMGKTDLGAVLNFLDTTDLDRQHLADIVMQRGGLVTNILNRDVKNGGEPNRPFDQPSGIESLRLLTLLLESPRARSGAVSGILAASPRGDHEWIGKVVQGLSASANFRLLINKRHPSALKASNINIDLLIAKAIPPAQKDPVLCLAKKHGKFPELYNATGWVECLELASESTRSVLFESDLGL
jgi:hypothetical protein